MSDRWRPLRRSWSHRLSYACDCDRTRALKRPPRKPLVCTRADLEIHTALKFKRLKGYCARVDVHAHYFRLEHLNRLDLSGGSHMTGLIRKMKLASADSSGHRRPLSQHGPFERGHADSFRLRPAALFREGKRSGGRGSARQRSICAHRARISEALCGLRLHAAAARAGGHRRNAPRSR